MPEDETNRRCCHKCQTTVTGKRKLSKCARCHSITYCSKKCQVEDWDRHKEYCIPVMVAEIPGKRKGLVASKDFKKGQVLFQETAAITVHATLGMVPLKELKEQVSNMSVEQKNKFYQMTPRGSFHKAQLASALRENCLQELDIFRSNCLIENTDEDDEGFWTLFIATSLLNHSCAPNVHLDANNDSDHQLEVRAIKDISKGEEVTPCYEIESKLMTSSQMKAKLKEGFSFDCKCGVCVGVIPNQDTSIREICSKLASVDSQFSSLYQKKMKAWMIEASKYERAADLTKQLYIGAVPARLRIYLQFVVRSQMARDPIRLEKAMNVWKEEFSAFGMREPCWVEENKSLQAKVERWSLEFQSKRKPTKEEIDDFFCCHNS